MSIPLYLSRIFFLLTLTMIPACSQWYEENFYFKVNADGSAELSFTLHRFDHWGDQVPIEGDVVGEAFGLAGVEKAAHLPIRVDMIHAEIPDIGKFKFHDISFSRSTGKDRMELEVRIPVGRKAEWMKRHPLLTQRFSNEKLIALNDRFGEKDTDEWDISEWFFIIDMPGSILRREARREGDFSENVFALDVFLDERNAEDCAPHLMIHAEAAKIEGDAAIIWTIESE